MVKLLTMFCCSSPTLRGRDYTRFWIPTLQSQPPVFAAWLFLISRTFTFSTFSTSTSSLLYSLQLPCDCSQGSEMSLLRLTETGADISVLIWFFSQNLPEVHNHPGWEKWERFRLCPGLGLHEQSLFSSWLRLSSASPALPAALTGGPQLFSLAAPALPGFIPSERQRDCSLSHRSINFQTGGRVIDNLFFWQFYLVYSRVRYQFPQQFHHLQG